MPRPRLGVIVPRDLPIADLLPFALRAEEIGLDEIWVVEDCFFRGGIAQAATILARTQAIRVGIGILPAAVRSPAMTALEAGTLAELHPGRLLLGIGHGMPGWMRQIGVWPKSPLTLLEETTGAVRALLHGERLSVDGRYVQLDDVSLHSPPPVAPPVLNGVRGPRSLEVAGRVADGTILDMPVTPEYLATVREAVERGRAAAGTSAPPEHTLVAFSLAVVHDDVAAAREIVRPALATFGAADWTAQIDPLPFAAAFRELRDASATPEAFARAMPDEWVDQLAIVGPPDVVRARLSALEANGVSSVVVVPTSPDPERPDDPFAALDALARVVLPAAR